MKKIVLITLITLFLTSLAIGDEFWNLRTTVHGTVVKLSDDHGMASGLGARFLFGERGGAFDVGFEIEKWYRTYELSDPIMDSLQNEIKEIVDGDTVYQIQHGKNQSENNQNGICFSTLYRMQLAQVSSFRFHIGAGGGFSFIQNKREEARLNTETGYWDVLKIADYLETKLHGMLLAGIGRELTHGLDFYLEGKFTYIRNAFIDRGYDDNGNPKHPDIWDDPYFITGILGLRYSF